MKILVIADESGFEECRRKLGEHDYHHLQSHAGAEKILAGHDLVFDFLIGEAQDFFSVYAAQRATVFLNTCKRSLA